MNESWVRMSWILTSDEVHHLPGRSSKVSCFSGRATKHKHRNGTLRFCHNQLFSYCNRIN